MLTVRAGIDAILLHNCGADDHRVCRMIDRGSVDHKLSSMPASSLCQHASMPLTKQSGTLGSNSTSRLR